MADDQTLDRVCSKIVDCPHSTPKWTDDGELVLRSQNIRGGRLLLNERSYTTAEHHANRSRRAEVQSGDLVITREAPMGEVCMVPPGLRCCLGQRMVLLRPDHRKIDGRFLLYALQSPEVQHQIGWSEGTGSTVSNLRIPHLKALRIPEHDRTAQEAIGKTLGSLDDKMEQNRRTAAKLEELARATFRAWFVDFAPVHAKAAGAKSYPGLPQAAFDALPTAFVDSEMGPVPEGWDVKPLNEACTINPRLKLKKGDVAPYLEMKFMPTSGHLPTKVYDREFGSGMRFQNGDTLVARITPCLENGKTALVDFLDDKQIGWGSTEYIVLRPEPPLPPTFIYCLARTETFREFAIQNMTGTSGRQRVPPTAMAHFSIALPPEATAFAFAEMAESLFELIKVQDCESQHLATLRDYLLPRLLSGAVRVQDAEEKVQATG